MTHDKRCNILGRYCWTHKMITETGMPGWGRKEHSDAFVRRSPWGGCIHDEQGRMKGYAGFTEAVIWANGDVERPKDSKLCVLCHNEICATPVLRGVEYNETKGTGYWAWAELHERRDTDTGDMIERPMANPDILQG